MLPKATWPPSAIQELDRTLNDTPADHEGNARRWERFSPATDDEIEDVVSRIEREQFAHAH